MPLVFSPISESVLNAPPKTLLPKHAFIMRQIGDPPSIDLEMFDALKATFAARDLVALDADTTTGSKDFLERILDLIRSTGFTVAIFSHQTRPASMANIALELGFAAMCGKPIVVVKSKAAVAPSDLKRTDWIDYVSSDLKGFERKLNQAIDEIEKLADLEAILLEVAIQANSPDCAVALERCNKGFLLSKDKRFVSGAQKLLSILNAVNEGAKIGDLERQRGEIRTFIRQARQATKALRS